MPPPPIPFIPPIFFIIFIRPPPFIFFIMPCICSNWLSMRFTSCTGTPAPVAMRRLRDALISSGFARSWGVIELMLPSMRRICLSLSAGFTWVAGEQDGETELRWDGPQGPRSMRLHGRIDRVDAGVDASGHPHQPFYSAGIALAHYLVKTFPEQCVWGTDWPHPHHTHVPDDGVLTDALAQIAPSEQALQALLVDNPLRLYKFDHVPSSIEPTEDAPA